MSSNPKIIVSADVSGPQSALDSLHKRAVEISKALSNAVPSGAMDDFERLADLLETKADGGLLDARQAQAFVDALKRAAPYIDKATGAKPGQSWAGTLAKEQEKTVTFLKKAESIQTSMARQGKAYSDQEARAIQRKYELLQQNDARFARFRKTNLSDVMGASYSNPFDVRARNKLMQQLGLAPHTGFWQSFSKSKIVGALPGGAVVQRAANDAGEATDSGGTGIGVFGKGMIGGLVGMAAFKAVQSISSGLSNSQNRLVNIGKLTDSLGGGAAMFGEMTNAVQDAATAFGGTKEDALAMAQAFSKVSGTLERGDMEKAGGFARAYGTSYGASSQFFAQARLSGNHDMDRLSVGIADAIATSGATPKMEEFMSVAGSFLQRTAQTSLGTPDAESFFKLLGGLTAKGQPAGLFADPSNAGALMMRADAGIRQGGGSQFSRLFAMGAAQRYIPGINAFDLPLLQQGGMFATSRERFGKGSVAMNFAEDTHNTGMVAHYKKLASGKNAGKTLLESLIGFGEGQYGASPMRMLGAIADTTGLDETSAAALYHTLKTNKGIAGASDKLKGMGINLGGVSSDTTKAKLLAVAGADPESLKKMAGDLKDKPGVGTETGKKLQDLIDKGDSGTEELRKMVAETTKQTDDGKSNAERQEAVLNNINTTLSNISDSIQNQIIRILNDISEASDFLAWPNGKPSIGGMMSNITTNFDDKINRLKEQYATAPDDIGWMKRQFTGDMDKIKINDQIKDLQERKTGYLSRFQGRKNPLLNTVKWHDEIMSASAATGVDPALIQSIMAAESSGNPNAVSNKGAGGLMQLMPGTAARFGVTDTKNPAQNVMGGAKYLQYLLKYFKGNVHLAIAAYNSGEGNVTKYGNKVPPFPETQKYVPEVEKYYHDLQDGVIGQPAQIPEQNQPTAPKDSPVKDKTSSIDINGTFILQDPTGRQLGVAKVSAPIPQGLA